MAQVTDKQPSVLRSLDWWTIIIYVALLCFGWISVCGASYTYGDNDIFSLGARSGMQIVWIGTSIALGFVLLMLDNKFYDTFAYVIYMVLLLLLFATIFNPHEIKGSRSWLVLGPLRLQPAEFAKFATALAVAKFMSAYGFDIHRWRDFATACGIVLLPMLFIVAQKETGSALVYLSFFLMFYREGMPGSVLFTGVAMVVYFVVGIRYGETHIEPSPTPIGPFVVLLLVQLFTAGMVRTYCKDKHKSWLIIAYSVGATVLSVLFAEFVLPFNIVYVQLAVTLILIGYLLYQALYTRMRNYFLILLFTVGSVAFFYSASYVLNNVMEPHQRVRINVLLGLDEDLKGAGYNVHQSEIAIGSGGLKGKGFLNGTQTKLKFVPEQDTDFIFCTVGEEEGFVGSAGVLLLFLALIIRLIKMAERQPFRFGRVYGYCVLSVFLFHVFINVGMVLGLTPVIGIPLPFFSYGGSSLWGFTILLFIFLRIDAARNMPK
ncbi:MAG: rod shape-determining protein RodA [Prevotella pectinovora]|uniref:rod shape-determining protein RodA n=1 Tax=Prevotella pectinovora TaxID=1602169 RepID=UPI002A812C0B|nr:rod shape-determining protein RodA [Prevotella pectinovora]MDY4779058.1 rod shape-determining protein RodA [Prevotella pectinovora]